MKDLTPQLIAEWESKLQDPDALTPGERYGLECKISKLDGALGCSATSELVKGIARKTKEELECRLEDYREPVPVHPSTMPKWHSKFTDYSGISVGSLEVAHSHLMGRIQNAHLIIAKTSHAYRVRGELIDAGVWDWKAPLFQCAPKGSLKAYYAALRSITREATSLEFALDVAERLEGREVPDTITQWNTSGLAGPAGGEDQRRFPELTSNLDWPDILDMAKLPADISPKRRKSQDDWRLWIARVDGVRFVEPTKTAQDIHVGF